MADDLTDILDQRAAFAQKFLGTTNLAQRKRYQEDIERADAAHAAEGQRQYSRALGLAELRDPLRAETLRLGRQREAGAANEAEMRQELAARRLSLDASKLDLDATKAEIAQRKAAREMDDAKRMLLETDAVEAAEFGMRKAGLLPGSKQYADGMVSILAANPFIDPGYRKTLMEGARIDVDPDAFMETVSRLKESGQLRNPVTTLYQDQNGRMRYSVREGKSEEVDDPIKQRKALRTEYQDALRMQEKLEVAGDREEEAAYWGNQAKEIFKQIKGLEAAPAAGSPTAAPATTVPAAVPTKAIDPDRKAKLNSILFPPAKSSPAPPPSSMTGD